MKKVYLKIIPVVIAILLAVSLGLNYTSNYYSSIAERSSNYVIFAISFYQASNLFCTPDYVCTFSNLTFPEFQKNELQKYQDQIDLANKESDFLSFLSNIFLFIAICGNFLLLYLIFRGE